jgi:hypothetical protein
MPDAMQNEMLRLLIWDCWMTRPRRPMAIPCLRRVISRRAAHGMPMQGRESAAGRLDNRACIAAAAAARRPAVKPEGGFLEVGLERPAPTGPWWVPRIHRFRRLVTRCAPGRLKPSPQHPSGHLEHRADGHRRLPAVHRAHQPPAGLTPRHPSAPTGRAEGRLRPSLPF